jgi:hypothetical protein
LPEHIRQKIAFLKAKSLEKTRKNLEVVAKMVEGRQKRLKSKIIM